MRKGEKFEKDIEKIYKMVADNENLNAIVRQNVVLKGRNGNGEQFDAVYEYIHFGVKYRVAIECKNYTTASIEKAQLYTFEKKLDNVGNINGIFISKLTDFQKGAMIAASDSGIKILKLEQLQPFISGENGEFLAPNSRTVGQPFWILIDTNVQDFIQGSLFLENTIYLFESQYFVEKFQESCPLIKKDINIMGVSQEYLKEIREMLINGEIKVKLFNYLLSDFEKSQFNFWDLTAEGVNNYI